MALAARRTFFERGAPRVIPLIDKPGRTGKVAAVEKARKATVNKLRFISLGRQRPSRCANHHKKFESARPLIVMVGGA